MLVRPTASGWRKAHRAVTMCPMIERGMERFIRLLKWGEKYTKTDMVYLFHGGFWLTVGQVVTTLSVLALGIVFANVLPKDVYGTYKYLLAIAGIFSLFTLPGMNVALIRAVARGFGGSYYSATSTRFKWSFIGVAAAFCGALYYAYFGNADLSFGLFVIAVSLPFFDTFTSYNSFLQGKKDFRTYVTTGAFVQIGSVLIMISAAFINPTLHVILISYLASFALLRITTWVYVRERYRPSGPVDPEVTGYAKHLSVMNILSQMASQADSILLFHFLGPVEVATYAVAIAPPEHMKNLISTVDDLLLPRFSARSASEIHNSLFFKVVMMFVFSAAFIGIYILVAPFAFHLLFPKYVSAVSLSQLFSLSLLSVASAPATMFLQAHKKVREQYYANVASSLFQILSMTLGVMWYGLFGLVIARVITRYLSAFLRFFLAKSASRAA